MTMYHLPHGRPAPLGRALTLGILLTLMVSGTVQAAVLRVKAGSASPLPDGTTWATAYPLLEQALATAQAGDEVWVAAGYYGEHTLKSGVGLYGGFAGSEEQRYQRDWVANVSELGLGDGSPYGTTAVTVPANASAQTVLDGFVLNGGSGVRLNNDAYGGGILCHPGSRPVIRNNTIREGRATYGSAIACVDSSPEIRDNTIDHCTSFAIACTGAAAPVIADNTFTRNGVSIIGFLGTPAPIVTGNTFVRNGFNPVIRYYPGAGGEIRNNVFAQNTGPGIVCDGASPLIAGNVLKGHAGAAISCSNQAAPHILNNTIAGNSGAGVTISQSSPVVENNLIAFNAAGLAYSSTSSQSPTPVFRNNCLFGNAEYDFAGKTNPIGKDGNFVSDPKLAAVAYGDLHIQPDSPCRNTGRNGSELGSQDLDGRPRILDETVDIGAFESDGMTYPATPRVFHVREDGSDQNSGASWDTAKRSVQSAIDAMGVDGGEVWVAAGRYDYTIPARIDLRGFVYLYGGFAGTETERDQRDWTVNVCRIPHMVIRGGHTYSAIDGFTINYRAERGITCEQASPRIVHNTISDCKAYSSGQLLSGGGLLVAGSRAYIADNTITGNTANGGGGLYLDNFVGVLERNVISGNTVSAQYSNSVGGGVAVRSGAPVIRNNRIENNRADSGAGAWFGFSTTATVRGNTFTGNACKTGSGGAVGVSSSSPVFDGNLMRGNTAVTTGGAFSIQSGAKTVLSGNLIVGNAAPQGGGGIYMAGAQPVLVNNTIVENTGGDGAGIHSTANAAVTMTNNVVAFNASGLFRSADSTMTLRHNDLFGNVNWNVSGLDDPAGVGGNISADPLFADRPAGDFRLAEGSPARDAGDDAVISPGMQDIDGQPRLMGDHVDMGAYEAPGAVFFRLSDVTAAMRLAAGLSTLDDQAVSAMDVVTGGLSGGRIDLPDVLALARKVAGLDANP